MVAAQCQQWPVPEIQRIRDQSGQHDRPRAERITHQVVSAAAGPDDRAGTEARQQRGRAGEWCRRRVQRHAAGDRRDAEQRDERTKVLAVRRRNRAQGQQRSDPEFPGARGGEIERSIARDGHADHGQQERCRRHQGGCSDVTLAVPRRDEQQEQRKQDVELFLDGERPRVQQRHLLRRAPEVTRLLPEQEIRGEEARRQHALGVVREIRRQQEPRSEHRDHEQHREQRRQQPAHAPLVEVCEREPARIDFVADQARDQEPRDDEEHVDADEAAREGADARVKQHDGNDRDRPEPVDVGTVVVHSAMAGPTRASPDPCAGRQRQIRVP